MTPELITAFGQFGAMGLLVWFLMWRDARNDDRRVKMDQERIEAQKERTEADKALAAALSALTVTVQHLEQRVK